MFLEIDFPSIFQESPSQFSKMYSIFRKDFLFFQIGPLYMNKHPSIPIFQDVKALKNQHRKKNNQSVNSVHFIIVLVILYWLLNSYKYNNPNLFYVISIMVSIFQLFKIFFSNFSRFIFQFFKLVKPIFAQGPVWGHKYALDQSLPGSTLGSSRVDGKHV